MYVFAGVPFLEMAGGLSAWHARPELFGQALQRILVPQVSNIRRWLVFSMLGAVAQDGFPIPEYVLEACWEKAAPSLKPRLI